MKTSQSPLQAVSTSEVSNVTLENSEDFCRQLERGKILFFSELPVHLEDEDIEFLLDVRQGGGRYHKNISYRPSSSKRLRGVASQTLDQGRLERILVNFSEKAVSFLSELLQPYSRGWRIDYTSFRPIEEQGRSLRQRARNDLLHVDAFPTRPTDGDRILRFFCNINPTEARNWVTGDTFEQIVHRCQGDAKWPIQEKKWRLGNRLRTSVRKAFSALGLPITARSRYDENMLRIHHYLKESAAYQENCSKFAVNFPPGSAWLVFTDGVAHAALSGRFALEQTVIVSKADLLSPQQAPFRVLESLSDSMGGKSPWNAGIG